MGWSYKNCRIKISKGLGILVRLRHCLPSRILVNLYYTLVHPYFDYCNIIWATGSRTSLNNLFLLQKKAMRITTNSSWLAHTSPIFNKLKVLTVFDTNKYKLFVLCLRFSISNYQVTLLIFLYQIVPYIIIILDRLLTFIYLSLILKVDS